MSISFKGKNLVRRKMLFCSNCEDVTKHEFKEKGLPGGDPDKARCIECGSDWDNAPVAVASGYEFNCPYCGHLNTECCMGDVWNGSDCAHCGREVSIADVIHAE